MSHKSLERTIIECPVANYKACHPHLAEQVESSVQSSLGAQIEGSDAVLPGSEAKVVSIRLERCLDKYNFGVCKIALDCTGLQAMQERLEELSGNHGPDI